MVLRLWKYQDSDGMGWAGLGWARVLTFDCVCLPLSSESNLDLHDLWNYLRDFFPLIWFTSQWDE